MTENKIWKECIRLESEFVKYEMKDHLAIITMSRSEKMNALNKEMLDELRYAWIRFESEDDAWIAILTGEGRAFCAGADTSLFNGWVSGEGENFLKFYLRQIKQDPFFMNEISKPTICAINGLAFGGGFDLALRGDFRIADSESVFRLPEPDLCGVLVIWDGLPHAVAMEVVSGLPITAQRAYEIGMVNKVMPKGQALAGAIEMAKILLKKPPLAVRKNIQILNDLKRMDAPISRRLLLDCSYDAGLNLSQTDDWREAMAALINKKPPVYIGR